MPVARFHHAAEASGYPVLLVASLAAQALMVGAIVILALTGAAWAFGLTMLVLVAALVLLGLTVEAAMSDEDAR